MIYLIAIVVIYLLIALSSASMDARPSEDVPSPNPLDCDDWWGNK